MGHGQRDCEIKLKKGDMAQFERWLRFTPENWQGIDETKHGGMKNFRDCI